MNFEKAPQLIFFFKKARRTGSKFFRAPGRVPARARWKNPHTPAICPKAGALQGRLMWWVSYTMGH